MSDPTDETPIPADQPETPVEPGDGTLAPDLEVEESAPDGGPTATEAPPATPEPVTEAATEPTSEPEPEAELAPAPVAKAEPKADPKPQPQAKAEPAPVAKVEPAPAAKPAAAPVAVDSDDDDEEVIEHVWYVLKVQSSREDTIRDALERRVKIQGLQRYFGRIVVPTEKITEIRNNKKRIVERKTYPGYIMIEMELNEKTWFLVRETPGVGDFVGAHQKPTQMTEAEVNQMLGQQTATETESSPKVRIDVERGDRVKIKDGPFENFEGSVEEVIEARGLVKVMLIIFNRPTPVDLEYWQVERI